MAITVRGFSNMLRETKSLARVSERSRRLVTAIISVLVKVTNDKDRSFIEK